MVLEAARRIQRESELSAADQIIRDVLSLNCDLENGSLNCVPFSPEIGTFNNVQSLDTSNLDRGEYHPDQQQNHIQLLFDDSVNCGYFTDTGKLLCER